MIMAGPYYTDTSAHWVDTSWTTGTYADTRGTYADTSYCYTTNYAVCGDAVDFRPILKKLEDAKAQPYLLFGRAGRVKVFQDRKKERVMDDQIIRRMIIRQRRSC